MSEVLLYTLNLEPSSVETPQPRARTSHPKTTDFASQSFNTVRSGFAVWGFTFWVLPFGFAVPGLAFRVWRFEFGVLG